MCALYLKKKQSNAAFNIFLSLLSLLLPFPLLQVNLYVNVNLVLYKNNAKDLQKKYYTKSVFNIKKKTTTVKKLVGAKFFLFLKF